MEPQDPILPPEDENKKNESPAAPTPLPGHRWLAGSGIAMTALAAAGGALLLLGVAGSTHTRGATRSVRLKWERNQREAAAAVDGACTGKTGDQTGSTQ